MSLDVRLTIKEKRPRKGSGIFVRENGETKEIDANEWRERNPGQTPHVLAEVEETNQVYWRNITNNLVEMADAAGIYKHLWRPDEIGITKAAQLIKPLAAALKRMVAEPDKFKALNPKNGWGTYEGLCDFISTYHSACFAYPDADIRVSR